MNTLDHLPEAFDAVVIGARCAGAATALLLARRGLSVLAVDQGTYGSDALSTHALMRAGVTQLARWGLLEQVRATNPAPIRHVAFHYGEDVTEIPIKPLHGVDALYAPRRNDLDPLLVDAARRAGADIRHHVKLVDLTRSPTGTVTGAVLADRMGRRVAVKAPIVIGADGKRSRVAELVRAPVYRQGSHAGAVVYGYFASFGIQGYHWHYRPQVGAGVIPSSRDQTCVFVGVPSRRYPVEFGRDLGEGFRRVLARATPGLAQRLAGMRPIQGFRAFAGEPSFVRQSCGDGWALVGDAGYFKDPSTAHGITDALVDAELLARAVAEGTRAALARYQSTRDALSFGLFDVTDAIASFDWDLERLESYHRILSEEMGRKLTEVIAFDGTATRAA